jgi:hypothetical protein
MNSSTNAASASLMRSSTKKESLHSNIANSKIIELTVQHEHQQSVFDDAFGYFDQFSFLPTEVKAVLAKNQLTMYDSRFFSQGVAPLSSFLLKEISIKSSFILAMWYSLFNFVYLSASAFDLTDNQHIQLDFSRLLLQKITKFEFMLLEAD